MADWIMLLPIWLPIVAGILTLTLPLRERLVKDSIILVATLANLAGAIALFKLDTVFSMPWAGFGFEFSIRYYNFSNFITLAAAFFGFLIALYSVTFMRQKKASDQFHSYLLITLGLVNGAVLADNMVLMLFFWEALLLTLFGMIAIGKRPAFKTATKAFIIIGLSDLCMMAGIAISGHLAGTLTLSRMSLSLNGIGALAFIFLMIGAISKAGSMPFHSWIPDAAIDAPLPFMAILPASLEKLVGIYFLTRISMDIFKLKPDSWASTALMAIGAITILLAVMMALIQKDYKKLLSYHAISQVGYMILGIGTALPAGIAGGLFHMINNALYKSCLFLTGGSVEAQAGTTDLGKLGGLWTKMPVTFMSFLVAALSISGVPPFNGFFSKELIYDAALERGVVFYLAALVGSFLTAASFLKLGHAAFLGGSNKNNAGAREAPIQMLIPMVAIAAVCVVFGLWNALVINKLIQPILGPDGPYAHNLAGFPANKMLVALTVAALLGALANHLYGVKTTANALKAVDHIHYAPGLRQIYDKAEKGRLDPYNIGLNFVKKISGITLWIDKKIDWFYDRFTVRSALSIAHSIKRLNDGNYSTYLSWSLVGILLVSVFLICSI